MEEIDYRKQGSPYRDISPERVKSIVDELLTNSFAALNEEKQEEEQWTIYDLVLDDIIM